MLIVSGMIKTRRETAVLPIPTNRKDDGRHVVCFKMNRITSHPSEPLILRVQQT
jgi:hypothetical protein